MDVEKNRLEGKSFEEVFIFQAQHRGLLVKKNNLMAKYIRGGRIQLEKSDLDFMLANQSGRVGFFDAKSFAGESFYFSNINPSQIERAKLYNEYQIPSGFVVFLRAIKKVYFYSGLQIHVAGPNNSFGVGDGLLLGTLWDFDLRLALGNTAGDQVRD